MPTVSESVERTYTLSDSEVRAMLGIGDNERIIEVRRAIPRNNTSPDFDLIVKTTARAEGEPT